MELSVQNILEIKYYMNNEIYDELYYNESFM